MKFNILIEPVKFDGETIVILDQRLLPEEEKYVKIKRFSEVLGAIKTMMVRGAPAIGVTAAFGYVLGIKEGLPEKRVFEELLSTRPTAVNLKNALIEIRNIWKSERENAKNSITLLTEKAEEIFKAEREREFKMAEAGSSLIPVEASILTHCNTGALATTGWGTALGVIRASFYSGKNIFVWVDETRPRLQGARLTSWELLKEGIPHKLISDTASSFIIKNFNVNSVLVGADRIALNGDTANKIGTYQLAISAKYHNIPFYVIAPTSTIDPESVKGEEIPIEMRSEDEIKKIDDHQIAPNDTHAYNPAFDITPAELITAIVTEKGISYYPFRELKEWI